MEYIAGYDSWKLDNPFRGEKEPELFETIFNDKIYVWDLKEDLRRPSQIEKYLKENIPFENSEIEIKGGRDNDGTYLMIYIIVYTYDDFDSYEKVQSKLENSILNMINI